MRAFILKREGLIVLKIDFEANPMDALLSSVGARFASDDGSIFSL